MDKDIIWIYSKSLARYLIEKGFECINVVKDIVYPTHFNWSFRKSDELNKCIEEYNKIKEEQLGKKEN